MRIFITIITAALLICLLNTCKKEMVNPYDLECPPEIWTPTDFVAKENTKGISLSWEQSEEHFDGYWIEISTDSMNWKTIHSAILIPEQKTFTDTLTYSGKTIQYRIQGKADLNKSDYCFSNKIDIPALPAQIITLPASDISSNSVTFNGEVSDDGGATVPERGFYYGTSPNVESTGIKIQSGNGTGTFSEALTGLQPGTSYYFKAYAINGGGVAYGDELTFTTDEETIACGDLETFTDARDGHEYKMVQIGEQVWMAENLAYLPSVSPSSAESYTDPYYYVYSYQGASVSAAKATNNYETYGVLYNWPAAMNACPSGWHLPTDDEWKQLEIYIGLSQSESDDTGKRGTDEEGKKLMAAIGWNGIEGIDEYCFSALPGGRYYVVDKNFFNVGYYGFWWSATEDGSSNAWGRYLGYHYSGVRRDVSGREAGFSVRCVKGDLPISKAEVKATPATDITETTATLHGEVTKDGGATVTERGFCYNTTGSPDITDEKVQSGSGTGPFSYNLENLDPATTYYVSAYALNSEGTAYGNEITFETLKQTTACGNLEIFTDSRDGHEYKMVQIGDQVWMAENLAYLPSVSPSSAESYTDPYYYVIDYQGTSVSAAKATGNYKTYGVLYNWPAALNACPSDWHLPTDDEWKQLEMHIGLSQSEADRSVSRGTDEGKKLKATSGWNSNGNGTDDYCFGALPGGNRGYNGNLGGVGGVGDWWSATEGGSSDAWGRSLIYNYSDVRRYAFGRQHGFSVRCVRD